MRFTPRSSSSSTSTPMSCRTTRQAFTDGTNSGYRSYAAMTSNTFDGGAAITISWVTLEAMCSSGLRRGMNPRPTPRRRASGFQRLSGPEALQERGWKPPDAALQVQAGVDGMSGSEQLRLAQHPVLEAGRRPSRLGERDLDGDEVVVAGRTQVLHGGLDHREDQAVLALEVAVAQALGPDELVSPRLEEAQVVRVVDDPHLIGVAVDDAQLGGDHERLSQSDSMRMSRLFATDVS